MTTGGMPETAETMEGILAGAQGRAARIIDTATATEAETTGIVAAVTVTAIATTFGDETAP